MHLTFRIKSCMVGLEAVVPSHTVIKRRVPKNQGITVERNGGILHGGRWQAR